VLVWFAIKRFNQLLSTQDWPMNLSASVCTSCTLLAALASTTCLFAQAPAPRWIASWGSSQQIPESHNALPAEDLRDATLREVVHLSAGGLLIRVHLSNAFGNAPLSISAARIARPLAPDSSSISPATDKVLLFNGAPKVVIPAGAEMISDPVLFRAAALSDLAVSIHLDSPPQGETGHPGSRATSYYVHGDATASAELSSPGKIDHWYQLTGVDVLADTPAAAIVALGDSITDGHAAGVNRNERWTDVLARRLQTSPSTTTLGVSNQGIGGNHLLTDGLGPNAVARFDRDVLAPAGVRWVILLEGVNDLGALSRAGEVPLADHAALVAGILGAYQQIITRAHAHGLEVYGATITPFVGSDYYHPAPLNEADRQQVNAFIRAPGHFDAVLDFDAVVRDPAHPDRLLPAFDSGDHLHPSPIGYKAMGDSIPLSLFR
jgi:lysophospholipase L1-like esterase